MLDSIIMFILIYPTVKEAGEVWNAGHNIVKKYCEVVSQYKNGTRNDNEKKSKAVITTVREN